jgi:hypothetical protein
VTALGLWATVLLSGVYHGLNPAMGWPLAVSAGLLNGGRKPLFGALGLLAVGHVLATAVILLPFALLTPLVAWRQPIRIGAALIVMAFGLWLLAYRRHPRLLARIRPTQLALWSFVVAIAHGAGLMLAPIYLELCRTGAPGGGHQAASALIGGGLATAGVVSVVHAAAMVLAAGLVAVAVHAWLGLRFLSRGWFNLEAVWASSLIAVGGLALTLASRGAA